MRIGIDARFYGPSAKGLGRYTQKLIENIEKIYDHKNDNIEFFVFLRKENFDKYIPQGKNFHKVLADYHWYTFKEQIAMPWILRKYNLDLVHFPHFNVPILYNRKFIVTIHDLILIHFPTLRGTTLSPLFYRIKFLAYKLTIALAIWRAQKIIAVSKFTRQDILHHYRISPDKIVVSYEACDDYCNVTTESSRAVLHRYGIECDQCGKIEPYILYVGNAYPHKNLEKLIWAFSRLAEREKDLKLVLVGKEDYFYNRLSNMVKHEGIRNVVFAGFVPDCDLDVVYKNSKLYVFPSLYEGFGLPPLEAMSRGVAVLSSNHECMKEVLGDSAEYFDATNEELIIKGIENLLHNETLKNELISKGYQQITYYSWEKMAREILRIYKDVLGENGKQV